MEKTLDFWFEYASPYSYPAAMRVEQLAEQAGVNVRWRVFLLGAVFQQYGWKTTPNELFPAKGNYMWHDMQRICASLNLPYQRPSTFPRNGMLAARISANYAESEWIGDFIRAVYTANFAHDQDIGNSELIANILDKLGQDSAQIIAEANSDEGKQKLKQQTQQALQQDVFGAPFMMVGNEPFWGNDRLEQAIYFAAHGKLPASVILA
ncbi:2-hydroxychromene-2-carboxylate isomerase [Alkanindiges illinoisensis]|uniref:2-hydroxychromene-2-carboxylate isomerase n=1 Tax=Alkanindiges illinoisensis TaxID=197183 RepID=A0A4Y7XFB4_9GAMM|nr:2-hydroxychromene-2-carboxylate isomerase [Alkanindiges illinoisensis]TEU30465.1 2-hydroxychromene-2-carboxylate isomerase [Alkanindiges illinoisensis]